MIDKDFKLNTSVVVKPFLSVDEQIKLLKSRGLIFNGDENNAKDILLRTNYYRLSAYWLTLETDNQFHSSVTFNDVYELYRCDDAFRKVILKYALYIEIAFRSYIAYEHARLYGPLGYMESCNFDNAFYHQDFITALEGEIARSDDLFVEHHKRELNSVFPIWAAIECVTFGILSKLYKNLKKEDRTYISKTYYGIHRKYVENWLQAIVYARNIAAHGGRFYYRQNRSVKVKLPDKYDHIIDNKSPFAIIVVMYKLQPTKALATAFRNELEEILKKYTCAKVEYYGFPKEWQSILDEEETEYSFQYR